MTDFVFTEIVNDPPARVESAALGVSAAAPFVEADVGKAVKLAALQNYVPVATGNDIEGIVNSVEPYTVNAGFSFGGVQRDGRAIVMVGTTQAGALAIGAAVVADVPVALGTAGYAKVQSGSPVTHVWRVLRHITGTGVTGDLVLIERV